MRKLTDGEETKLSALKAVALAAASKFIERVPGLGEAIQGVDAYKREILDRQVAKALEYLKVKVTELGGFSGGEYLETDEGKRFARKLFDCAFDVRNDEKQQLFLNAFLNGIRKSDVPYLEKSKFLDILTGLSAVSLEVLSHLHKKFEPIAVRPGRGRGSLSPNIQTEKVVEELGKDLDPYLIGAAMAELKSSGLFSNVIGYLKGHDGKHHVSGYYAEGAFAYTDFTCRFVEFILPPGQSPTN